jgi:hypothetical protein
MEPAAASTNLQVGGTMLLSTNAETGYLRANLSGPFVLADAKQEFLFVIELLAQSRSGRVLVDGRALSGSPRAIERYLYSVFAARATQALQRDGQRAPKFAYVLTPPVLDPQRMGEKLARERGMEVRAFESLPAAVMWLVGPDR